MNIYTLRKSPDVFYVYPFVESFDGIMNMYVNGSKIALKIPCILYTEGGVYNMSNPIEPKKTPPVCMKQGPARLLRQ